jgi:hypothetical protein
MNIPVIYFDGNHGTVATDKLDEMIERRLIIEFFRSSEWINAADCRHRGSGGRYYGPDRRERLN